MKLKSICLVNVCLFDCQSTNFTYINYRILFFDHSSYENQYELLLYTYHVPKSLKTLYVNITKLYKNSLSIKHFLVLVNLTAD